MLAFTNQRCRVRKFAARNLQVGTSRKAASFQRWLAPYITRHAGAPKNVQQIAIGTKST